MPEQVNQAVSNRPVTEQDGILSWINRVAIPALIQIRSLLNALLLRSKSGDCDPTIGPDPLVPSPVEGSDGDLYVWRSGTVGAQLWIMTAGVWRAIA